jgi:hypothetical protein
MSEGEKPGVYHVYLTASEMDKDRVVVEADRIGARAERQAGGGGMSFMTCSVCGREWHGHNTACSVVVVGCPHGRPSWEMCPHCLGTNASSAEPGRGNEPALEAHRVGASRDCTRQASEGVSFETPDQIAARCVPDVCCKCCDHSCGYFPCDWGRKRQAVAAEIERAERRGAAKALRELAEDLKDRSDYCDSFMGGGDRAICYQNAATEALRRAEEREKL